jgi:hypothetical protein
VAQELARQAFVAAGDVHRGAHIARAGAQNLDGQRLARRNGEIEAVPDATFVVRLAEAAIGLAVAHDIEEEGLAQRVGIHVAAIAVGRGRDDEPALGAGRHL